MADVEVTATAISLTSAIAAGPTINIPTAWYRVENNAKDTLDGAVSAGDSTITLNDASEFPTTMPFLITVWDRETYYDPGDDDGGGSGEGMEVMRVIAISGNVLTVTRNQDGVGDVGHADGDAVRLHVVAELLEQITGVITLHDHHPDRDGAAVSHGDLADLSTGTDHSYIGQDVTTTGTPRFAGVSVGIPPVPTPGLSPIYLSNWNIDSAANYIGMYSQNRKTAGASTTAHEYSGAYHYMRMEQAAGTIGNLYGTFSRAILTDGNVGDAIADAYVYGARAFADLDGGKVWGDVRGLLAEIDQEAANEITGDAFAAMIRGDFDGTVGGTTYMMYLWEQTGVDYGFYQNGTAKNVLGGTLYFGAAEDTNLYRSAANALKTDDSFAVGATVDVGSTTTIGGQTTVTHNGQSLRLAGTSLTYMGFYRLGLGNARSAYLGHPSGAAATFTIANEVTDADLRLICAGTGTVVVHGTGLEVDGDFDHDGSNVGFYGTAPIAQAVLATGVGATVDNVITALQNLGLVKQS